MEILGTLNFWLWVAQVVLALLYLMAGFMKAFRPIPDLAKMMAWPGQYPRLTRFVGTVELIGPFGLILPMATGILPWLTPLAALGFTIIQVLAIGFHGMRGETSKTIGLNIVLLALGLFVLWGRWSLFGF